MSIGNICLRFNNLMDAKSIQSAVNDYYRSLLKEYGAKFDMALDEASIGAAGSATAAEASGSGVGTVKSSEANTENNSDMKTEVKTDTDGTVYLLITSPNGVSMKIKIGNETDNEKDLLEGIQKAKKNSGVMDYEKNIDAFFEEKSGVTFSS